jgi:hypothetical protein
VKRLLSALAGVAAGGLLAASGLFGASSATTAPEPSRELLRVDDYCRQRYGGDATAYQPAELGAWRCSVWRNGVWGLEPLDLNAACHWQRGERSRVVRHDGSERALACTL